MATSPTTPPSMTTPPVAPNRNDPTPFRVRMDNFLAWLVVWVLELVDVMANIYDNAVSAFEWAEESEDSATASAASASASSISAAASASNAVAAAANAGASAWVSGTTYAIGNKRWSLINGRVYTRQTAGAGATDPALDRTNWGDPVDLPRVRVTGATALQAGHIYELDSTGGSFSLTLPASFAAADRIGFADVGYALVTNPVTVLRNGNDIRRTAEDLICDRNGDSFFLVGQTSIGWIEE